MNTHFPEISSPNLNNVGDRLTKLLKKDIFLQMTTFIQFSGELSLQTVSKYIDVHISIPEEIRTTFKNMHDKIVSDRLV